MLTNLSLFSGCGGLDLGAKWTGKIRTVCYVENDPYAQAVLMSRMRDGGLDAAPIFEDVRTFDGSSLAGSIDIVSGGFPCADLSWAGKRKGLNGPQSGLWFEMARIIGEVGSRFALLENVSAVTDSGWIGVILGRLADMGYDAQWGNYGSCAVGAPHPRRRMFLMAYAKSFSRFKANPKADKIGDVFRTRGEHIRKSWQEMAEPDWTIPPSWLLRDIDGVAFRSHRTRCTGLGVVPQQSLPAWQKIIDMSESEESI